MRYVFNATKELLNLNTRILLVLELNQLIIDLLNVDVGPQYVVVAVHGVNNGIIQPVKLLEEIKLLLDLEQFWVLRDGETEEFLSPGVRQVLPV